MFTRERRILQEISDKLSAELGVRKVIAYGSRVRGDFREDSDLDVLIIVDRKDREIKSRIVSVIYDYELETDISFSVSIFSRDEFEFNEKLGSPFIKSIAEEGLVLYDAERGREKDPVEVPAR